MGVHNGIIIKILPEVAVSFHCRSFLHVAAARYITSPSRPRGKNSGCSAPGAMSWAVGLRGSLGTLWIFNIAIENHHL